MASSNSKALVLCLAFALVLLVSRVYAREFTKPIPDVSVDRQKGHEHGSGHSHGRHGSGSGHGREERHRRSGHGHDERRHHGKPGHGRYHPEDGAAGEEHETED